MLTWEWNFNLGTILPLIFAAGVFYAITKSDMRVLKDNVVEIRSALAKQADTIAQIAVQKERLDSMGSAIAATQSAQKLQDQRLYDLSTGRGFVRSSGGIDGEWPKRD